MYAKLLPLTVCASVASFTKRCIAFLKQQLQVQVFPGRGHALLQEAGIDLVEIVKEQVRGIICLLHWEARTPSSGPTRWGSGQWRLGFYQAAHQGRFTNKPAALRDRILTVPVKHCSPCYSQTNC